MKESVAIAKEVDTRKESSPTRSDNSIQRLRDEPERQLGSLRAVIGNIRRNGCTPSVESIATELSVMPSSDRASALLVLQQTHGNHYVQRVVTGIQAKLTISQPGDKYEQEADRVATDVVRITASDHGTAQSREIPENKEDKNQFTPLARHALVALVQPPGTGNRMIVTPGLEAAIHRGRGRGQTLSGGLRKSMEQVFGVDFSGVRVHEDAESDRLNQALHARAFTMGQDVFFRQAAYDPKSSKGQKLIAHELTHVVQQSADAIRPRSTDSQHTGIPAGTEVDTSRRRVEITQRAPHIINRWATLGSWSWTSSIRGPVSYTLKVGTLREWEWVLERGDETYIVPMLLALSQPNWVGARREPGGGIMSNMSDWQNTIRQNSLTREQILGFMLALYRSSRGLQLPGGPGLFFGRHPFDPQDLLRDVIQRYQSMVLMEESNRGPGVRVEGVRRLAGESNRDVRNEMILSAFATAMAAPVRISYANRLREQEHNSQADAEERNAYDEIISSGHVVREVFRASEEIRAAQQARLDSIFDLAWAAIPGGVFGAGAIRPVLENILKEALKGRFKTIIRDIAQRTNPSTQLPELNRQYAIAVEQMQISAIQYGLCRNSFASGQARAPD